MVAPFRRVRTERASVLRAVLDEEVRHTTRRTSPLRMAGDPHFAHHCRVVTGAGPFVVFGDACPACSVPSGRTPEIVRNKRIPLLVPRPAQNRSRSW